jgi:hypothetical protein
MSIFRICKTVGLWVIDLWILLIAVALASSVGFACDSNHHTTIAYGNDGESAVAYDAPPVLTGRECENVASRKGVLLGKFADLLAAEGARFSRVGGAAGDFLVPGEGTLQAALQDPAMYGTRLTTTPTFNAGLDPALYGRTLGSGLNASVEIGPTAFSSRGNRIQTIIHEETHIRLDLRAAQGSQRAIGIQGSLTSEEAYVESVAQRYWRMYGGR